MRIVFDPDEVKAADLKDNVTKALSADLVDVDFDKQKIKIHPLGKAHP
jgi:hypothetical protein